MQAQPTLGVDWSGRCREQTCAAYAVGITLSMTTCTLSTIYIIHSNVYVRTTDLYSSTYMYVEEKATKRKAIIIRL